MWQTTVGNDMSLYSIPFRVQSCRFTVGHAEKWLAINGDVGNQSQVLDDLSATRKLGSEKLFNRHYRSFEQGKHPLGHESQPRHGRENEKRRKTELRDKTRRTSLLYGIGFFSVCAFLPPEIEAEYRVSGWTNTSA
jgi:hypothetical protein